MRALFLLAYVPWIIALAATLALLARLRFPDRAPSERGIALVVGTITLVYPAFLTALQAYVWSQTAFTRLLLSLPLEKDVPLSVFEPLRALFEHSGGYFMFYSGGRFWMPALLTIGAACALHILFRLLHRKRPESVSLNEVWLLTAAPLIVSFGAIGYFIPLAFVCALVYACVQRFRGRTARIGSPIIVALFGTGLSVFFIYLFV